MKRKFNKERIEERIRSNQRELANLKKAEEDLKSLKFKPGDVVYHKDYGNCVVSDLYSNSFRYCFIDPDLFQEQGEKEIEKGYYVNSLKDTGILVSEKEIAPFGKASKILYEKK